MKNKKVCKDCNFFILRKVGERGGCKGKCRMRRPNEMRIGCATACRFFEAKEE